MDSKVFAQFISKQTMLESGTLVFYPEVPMGLANLYVSVQKVWFHSPQ